MKKKKKEKKKEKTFKNPGAPAERRKTLLPRQYRWVQSCSAGIKHDQLFFFFEYFGGQKKVTS